jgi:signal transduction histidine kinase
VISPAFLSKRDLSWDALIIASAFIAVLINFVGLSIGISVVIPHLLYIPVVIAAYRYPKWGLTLAGCIGGAYLLIVILVSGNSFSTITEAFVRTIVVIIIGWLIAWLSFRLREREDLYRGVFYHSEAGNILVRDTGPGRIIEEVNEKAVELLHRAMNELKGSSPEIFWGWDFEQDLFSRLTLSGGVFVTEAEFLLPDGTTETVLLSAASLPGGRTIITFVEISRRVFAEKALKAANDKLSLLSRIAKDHLQRTIDHMAETVNDAELICSDNQARVFFELLRALTANLTRQLKLTESYKNLGLSPPAWMGVQKILESLDIPRETRPVSFRFWTERLEIYADPLFNDVLVHIIGNSIAHGVSTRNVVVTYHETPEGLDLILEDDGVGIPAVRKQQIFEYDAGGHAGIGLFICREILGVTGMTVSETGTEGKGARFVIHVLPKAYRIEGTGDETPAFPHPDESGEVDLQGARHITGTIVRELHTAEFPRAEALWLEYHPTQGDPLTDRIFAGFVNREIVSLARCRKHPDGFEVDAVFTPVIHRGHGFAHAVMWGLVEACGHDPLYMHSIRNLTGFYSRFGFVPIEEKELPPSIRERYAWAMGEMEGADVSPMKRSPSP